MYKIQSKIIFEEKELTQIQYISENFMLTEINGKKLLFIPDNTLFSVDVENKSLKAIDISSQAEQINKVKTMLGELKTESINKSEDIASLPHDCIVWFYEYHLAKNQFSSCISKSNRSFGEIFKDSAIVNTLLILVFITPLSIRPIWLISILQQKANSDCEIFIKNTTE